jgi:pyrimidine operon attenuation protein/uracil phosphoribosyltransferase
MPKAREILSAAAMSRALARIASEIVERNHGLDGVVLIGVRTRGVPLAERLADRLRKTEGVEVPVGILDIALYRDDIVAKGVQPIVRSTEIAFPVDDRVVVLIDDVLYTGRTVRAALDALVDLGRPRCIQLAVLVDRGHRELPVAADYVGKACETTRDEQVKVQLLELDGRDTVSVEPAAGG